MKQLQQSEGCTRLGVVNRRREPFASHQLLAIRYRSFVTAAKINGDVVQAICVHNDEVFMAGVRSHANGVNVSQLYAKAHRFEGHLLEASTIPTLVIG